MGMQENIEVSEAHVEAHNQLAYFYNRIARPYLLSHNTPNIDTGVALWTPAIGTRIIGVSLEMVEPWSETGEEIGIGVGGGSPTSDADLVYCVPALDTMPDVNATFPHGQGFMQFGPECVRITATTPLIARTKIGGNTTGSMRLVYYTLVPEIFDPVGN